LANLVTFYGATEANRYAGLIADADGNLFGTPASGGANRVYRCGHGAADDGWRRDRAYGWRPDDAARGLIANFLLGLSFYV